MMARRMMRKHHVRCRAGEKVEITSKPYLSLSILVECGKMLQKGTPKIKDGKPVLDKNGKVIYEPYKIKVLNTVIRQIKRCRFRQIKTGLSEHLTMG